MEYFVVTDERDQEVRRVPVTHVKEASCYNSNVYKFEEPLEYEGKTYPYVLEECHEDDNDYRYELGQLKSWMTNDKRRKNQIMQYEFRGEKTFNPNGWFRNSLIVNSIDKPWSN